MIVRKLPSNDELYHHGVKGQKWGVRKQRFPLGTRRRRMEPISDTTSRPKRPRTASQRFRDTISKNSTKRAIKAVAITTLAAKSGHVAYKLYKKKKINRAMVEKGREIFVNSYRVMNALPKY